MGPQVCAPYSPPITYQRALKELLTNRLSMYWDYRHEPLGLAEKMDLRHVSEVTFSGLPEGLDVEGQDKKQTKDNFHMYA
uniref:Uncharacterized protein n=1 Tax=Macaca fascicularis TaxID=9541 RepID=A0A7N9D8J2_MACFA